MIQTKRDIEIVTLQICQLYLQFLKEENLACPLPKTDEFRKLGNDGHIKLHLGAAHHHYNLLEELV